MLLILAHPDDATAHRIAAAARRRSIPCLQTDAVEEIELTVGARRDGTTRVRIAWRGEQPVRAVINRAAPAADPRDAFLDSERLAGWWAALQHFDGPVVNRPGRDGYLPELWPWRLASRLSSFAPSRIQIAGGDAPPPAAARTVVHRLPTGVSAGHFAAERRVALDSRGVYAFTPLEPSRTSHLLLAGDRCFDLVAGGEVDARVRRRVAPLLAELRAREALLAGFLVEVADRGLRLLRVTPTPSVREYESVAPTAHAALLDALGVT